MPFKSIAQARFMFKNHPQMAQEWAKKTNFKSLPERLVKNKAIKKSAEVYQKTAEGVEKFGSFIGKGIEKVVIPSSHKKMKYRRS